MPASVDATAPAKMDPKHPFRIGYEYYPIGKDGARHNGTCDLALQVEPDGSTYAMQLLISTGQPELDAACIEAVNGVRLLPGTTNGKASRSWSVFKFKWNTTAQGRDSARTPLRKLEDFTEPHIQADYMLHVGPSFYPDSARPRKESGFCVVNIRVDHAGNTLETRLSKPTGFADLDHACINVASLAELAPLGESAESAWATLVIFWRPD